MDEERFNNYNISEFTFMQTQLLDEFKTINNSLYNSLKSKEFLFFYHFLNLSLLGLHFQDFFKIIKNCSKFNLFEDKDKDFYDDSFLDAKIICINVYVGEDISLKQIEEIREEMFRDFKNKLKNRKIAYFDDIKNETDLLILDNWQNAYYGNMKMDWMVLK